MIFNSLYERNNFIESNLPLVIGRVKKQNKGIFDDDLYQVGSLALIKATDRFDENKGVKFSTYAISYIDGYISKYKRYDTLIRPYREHNKWQFHYIKTVSLNAEIDSNNITLEDIICDDSNIEQSFIIRDYLKNHFLENLSNKDNAIIKLNMNSLSQSKISQIVGVSQQHVSRIINREREKCFNYCSI